MDRSSEPSPIFDALDIDLVVKVLAHTAFSPFFTFFIPIFYYFQGARYHDPIVLYSGGWFVAMAMFWGIKWLSLLYRNQGSLLFGPAKFDWDEQVVLITGGSSGIGELLANTLAVRSVNVVVLDVKPIQTENYNITYYKCDVSKWEEVEAVSKKVIEEIGAPTILVNNAGIVQGKLILDLEPEEVKATFGVNTLAHFWTLKAFLPSMIANKSGHIVTVSSTMGYTGLVQMADYCASKAALVSLHESLRYELDIRHKCPNIRTTLVVPGQIATRMFSTIKLPESLRFFFPSVQPVTVVKSIIAALDDQYSTTIMLPFYANFVPVLRHLPSFMRDFSTWFTGANYAMEGFSKQGSATEKK